MKPMLAVSTDYESIPFPVLASPKLDGVRALIIDGVVMSRSLKPIPNQYVQRLFGRKVFNGFDGELVVGDPTDPDCFRRTSSGVMTIEGAPAVTFHVFDLHSQARDTTFAERFAMAKHHVAPLKDVVIVPHIVVYDHEQLTQVEASIVHQGYEGVMLRHPDGLYKHGRSTLKQGWLLKLKRFEDSEARIIGYECQYHNTNVAKRDELGRKVRSHEQAGMEPMDLLGSLSVKDLTTDVVFDIGTGFTAAERAVLWQQQDNLIGRIVKYKYQPTGVKDKPRFPVFLGFRDPIDM